MDEELVEPMRIVNARIHYVRGCSFSCPRCSAKLRVVGVKLFPKWVCDKCFLARNYEPLKLIKEKVNE